jgi:hypothetical protein
MKRFNIAYINIGMCIILKQIAREKCEYLIKLIYVIRDGSTGTRTLPINRLQKNVDIKHLQINVIYFFIYIIYLIVMVLNAK